MKHHHIHEQRLAAWIAVIAALLIVAVATPLIVSPAFRLWVGYTFELVPGSGAERLFAPETAVELVVLREEIPVEGTLPTTRLTAVYVVERGNEGIILHDLNEPRTLDIPLDDYDLISAADDHSAVLLVDHGAADAARAALIDVDTGAVQELPAGDTVPDIPGDWTTDVSASGHIGCSAVSPQDSWVACVARRNFPRFILGDWEVRVHPYGRVREAESVFRGRGFDPLGGWTLDESTLYLQNETGVWRVPVE